MKTVKEFIETIEKLQRISLINPEFEAGKLIERYLNRYVMKNNESYITEEYRYWTFDDGYYYATDSKDDLLLLLDFTGIKKQINTNEPMYGLRKQN